MYKLKVYFPILMLLALGVSSGCNAIDKNEKYPSSPDYDLAHPTVIHLRHDLDEISGIVYYPKDTSLLAINDEQGILYKIYLRQKIDILYWKFSKGADFEDLVLLDSTFYALQSNGNITRFKFINKDSLSVEICDNPLKGKNEFESLYYDAYFQKLVMICKDCKEDDKNNVTALAFDPVKKEYLKHALFNMNNEQIYEKLDAKKEKFKPSGAVINPISKELYIISAVNNALVIASRDGKVRTAYPLDPKLFKQPEGITFAPNGDLYISNEAAEVGAANILVFKYKPMVK